MAEQPQGTVTLLFSDIEGSTRLLQELGREGYAEALDRHRQLLRDAFDRHDGYEVDYAGDAFFVAFASAQAAVAAAREAQDALAQADRPSEQSLRVRIGIHTGSPLVHPPKYVGLDVHRAARIMAAGHGGQVLISQATRSLVGDRVELRDLGSHRLKDLQEPEWLFQLGDEEFPPLKSLNNTNLPAPANPLVGREHELAELTTLLRRQDVRLLTLTGAGGTGKTRLAVEAAAELVGDYPNGVFFVPLAPVADPALVLPTIAQMVGVRERAGEPVAATLGRELEPKTMLLVLDNLEQVVDAAPQLGELLERAPRLKLLVTSREPLHLGAEHDYTVLPLSETEAVELFRARATRSEPLEAVVEICRRLDGLPLAIELAAARTKVLPPARLLERLEPRLPLLTGKRRDVPARQRTLRATIAWSYDLLSVREQQLFAGLAVFVGGCVLEAAQDVGGADLETLESLVDKSLLRQREEPEGVPRFWMLETIREYGVAELEQSGAGAAIRDRHADWVVGEVTRGVDAHWGRTPEEWYSRVAPELDNVRAALDWLGATNGGERFARICIAMRGYWHLRGSSREGATHLERALTLDVPDGMRPGVLIGVAWLARSRMDLQRLRSAAQELVEIGEREGRHDAMVAGLRDLGMADAIAGDTELALSRWREALALARDRDLQGYLPGLTGNLAAAELQRHNWDAARTLSAEAAEFADRNGDVQAGAISRLNEGTATILGGDPAAARRPLLEALEIGVGRGWTSVAHEVLDALAAVDAAEGKPERAARLMGAAEQLREDGGLASEPLEEEHRRGTCARLREALGDKAFDDAFAAGRRLGLAEAAAAARG